MTKGEKRFEDALLRCLFPGGVPANHRIKRTPESAATFRAIQTIGKDTAERFGIELRDDIDEEVP